MEWIDCLHIMLKVRGSNPTLYLRTPLLYPDATKLQVSQAHLWPQMGAGLTKNNSEKHNVSNSHSSQYQGRWAYFGLQSIWFPKSGCRNKWFPLQVFVCKFKVIVHSVNDSGRMSTEQESTIKPHHASHVRSTRKGTRNQILGGQIGKKNHWFALYLVL